MQILSTALLLTWTGGVLQVTQAGLFGDPVDQLARLAVLVAGRQVQRGQLLGRVLVQHQALVHHHRRGEAVLWGTAGQCFVRTSAEACLSRQNVSPWLHRESPQRRRKKDDGEFKQRKDKSRD